MTMPATDTPAARTSLGTYLSYGVGMTGNQIMRDVPTALLLFYMTNALMIPPSYAGFAILLPKVWVIVADPLVGTLSDRTRTRWGARKPFLFAGSIISTITFLALFIMPVPASPVLATLLVGTLYLLMATGYSIYSVPYLALAAEIADTPRERTTALSYKQLFCLVGVVAGLSLAPWMIAHYGGGQTAYARMALAIGAILLVTTLATALLVPTRHATVTDGPPPGNLLSQVRGAFSHRPFTIVFLAATLQLLGFGVNQAGALYFLIYILHMPMELMSLVIVGAVLGSGLSQPLWVKLSVRFGTVRAYLYASLFAAFMSGIVVLIPPGATTAFVVYSTISGAATCGFTLLSFAALIEAIALDGPDSQRKGLFAAAYTAMEKAMLALGGFVVALTLAAGHFVQGASIAAQPASVSTAIVLAYVALPVVLKLVSAWVLSLYGKPEDRYAVPPAAMLAEPAE